MDDSKKNKYRSLLRAYVANNFSEILVNGYRYLIKRDRSRTKVYIVDFIETYDGFKPRHKTVHLSLDTKLWQDLIKVYIGYFCKNIIPESMSLRKVYSDSYPFKRAAAIHHPIRSFPYYNGMIILDSLGQVEIDKEFKPSIKDLIKDMWK